MPPTRPHKSARRRWPLILLVLLFTTTALYYRLTGPQKAQISVDDASIYSCEPDDPPKRVAIVGAGSGGASAAYYIHRFARDCPQIQITVFERNLYVGGRSTTVFAHDDPSEPAELGASIFVQVNHNLVSAVKKFGLGTNGGYDRTGLRAQEEEDDDIPDTIGVYDGEEWRYISPYDPTKGYWTIIKLLWQYGTSPIRTNNLMKSTVSRFLSMYTAPVFPFRSLTAAVQKAGLADEVATTGLNHLHDNGVADAFAFDIVQASTRVNYASNLDRIHGVETMVCMAANGAMSVKGGNWQIFASMLSHSGANLMLNTSVVAIDHESDDDTYTVTIRRPGRTKLARATFDTVILASPFQFAELTLTPPPRIPIAKVPYVKLHVTLFTSPYRLDPLAFKMDAGAEVPRTILTTTTRSDDDAAPSFISISTLRMLRNPNTGGKEYLYKVFSRAPLAKRFLDEILATPGLDSGEIYKEKDAVTWRYNKIWHSYPEERPRVTFEEVRYDLPDGGELWYTSSIEGFISTMETSSLSGMNVARLVVEGWQSQKGWWSEAKGARIASEL